MTNRVTAAIERVRGNPGLAQLEGKMDITFTEHFSYQQAQARAHASGRLNLEEAQTVYNALGEGYSSRNGGWAMGTDLATKVVVTKLVGELVL